MAPEVAVLALLGFCLLFPTFVGQVAPPNVAAVLTPDLAAVIGSNRQAPWTFFLLGRTVVAANSPDASDRALPKTEILESWTRGPFQAVHMKQVGAGCPGYLSTYKFIAAGTIYRMLRPW